MKIEKFSHHFVVHDFSLTDKAILLQFVVRFAETTFDRFGARVIARTYAASTKSRKEFRFHINSYDNFAIHLRERGVNISELDVVEYPLYEPVKVEYGDVSDPRGYQIPIIKFNVLALPRSKLVELQTGKGKALVASTPILTPIGWVPINSLKIGSIVNTPNGWRTRVTGIYPQGQLPLYKITFKDGRVSRCCKEHLWKVYYINTTPSKRWRIVNTEEMIRLINMPNPRVYIPLPEAWCGIKQDLPLHPYLLGALLGDGGFTGTAITFSNNDQFVVDKVNALLNDIGYKLAPCANAWDYRIVYNGNLVKINLKETLKSFDLLGKMSEQKHIPPIYLDALKDERIELLQGLMDTDGTSDPKSGSASFSTSSEQLAKGIQYLIRSLEGMASIQTKDTTYSYKGEMKNGLISYRLYPRMRKPSLLFSLPRKLVNVSDDNQYAKDLKLQVMSIEPDGIDEAVCISVEHPDKLYIAEDFVVTHNTFIALASIAQTNERFVLATKGGFVSRWLKDVCGDDSVLHLAHNDVIVVKGSEALKTVIQLALTDQLEFTGLLISTNTLNNYYKHYFDNDGDMEEYGGLHPVALWALLKVGTLITDEFHMLLHMNYIREMYNHVPKTIALSATMIPTSPFMKMIHDTLFPKECRAPAVEYDKYISVKALMYGTHHDTKDIKCFRNSKYNHTMYEESIVKRPKVLKNYLEMITTITNGIFVGEGKRLPGEKMIVYVSTVEMATLLTEHFKKRWGDAFPIKRFVSADPYSNVEDAELIVSTPGSLGTAHDVANLRFTLLTTALGKEDTNVQLLGRLRRLKNNPDVTPEMFYLVNRDIKKHMDYHQRKRELFKPITLSQYELETPFKV